MKMPYYHFLLFNYQAETDGIEFLEQYRGKSEPTFLFYGVS